MRYFLPILFFFLVYPFTKYKEQPFSNLFRYSAGARDFKMIVTILNEKFQGERAGNGA